MRKLSVPPLVRYAVLLFHFFSAGDGVKYPDSQVKGRAHEVEQKIEQKSCDHR